MKFLISLMVIVAVLAGSAHAADDNQKKRVKAKPVEVVNAVRVRGPVETLVTEPIEVHVLSAPDGGNDGVVQGARSTRLLCSYNILGDFNCTDTIDTFPEGARLLIHGLHGVVSHTADGGGASGFPGGLCEGSVSAGGLVLAKIQVQPGQSQAVSRDFSRPFEVSPQLFLSLNSGRTGGGSCLGNLDVIYELRV